MTKTMHLGSATSSFTLTRKGRRLLQTFMGLIILVVTVLAVCTLWFQQPLSSAVAADQHNTEVYEQIVVQPGDTLWGISTRLSEHGDRAAILQWILAYNDLESSELEIGQLLYIPVVD